MKTSWKWHLLSCAAAGVTLLVITRLLASSSLVTEGSIIDGLDYLPPSWLLLVILPVAGVAWVWRRRLAVLPMLVLFICLMVIDADFSWRAAPASPPRNAASLTVATVNLQWYRHGRDRVSSAVKGIAADVVFLSENDMRSGEVADFHALYSPLHFYPGRSQETAILSRYPLRDVREIELPSFQASLRNPNRLEEQASHPHRSFIHAQLDIGGATVHLISIRFIAGRAPSSAPSDQLKWGRYLVSTHHREGRFFVDYLSRLRGPVIFGGDLNAPPSSKLIRRLTDVAQDAYLATNWWGRPTFQVKFPLVRLDYLFGMNGATAVESRRLPEVHSDHFPVWARFAVD
jgi:endonuclease/exonuclease/phosphatase (EEP) superfamily protein YafD